MASAANIAAAATPPTVAPTMIPVLEGDTEWIKQYIGMSPQLTYHHITLLILDAE